MNAEAIGNPKRRRLWLETAQLRMRSLITIFQPADLRIVALADEKGV